VDALQRAIELAGSQAELAEMLGVVPMAVTNWKLRTRGVVPVAQAIAIEKALRGAVTREQLRPDIFGAPKAKPKRPKKAA
jgi:DNA-binding transcriptional regulator YdaS (Cro superfamily)